MTLQRPHKGSEPQPALGADGTKLRPPSGVTRTCVITRRALPPNELLPLALFNDQVIVGRAPRGRGAYVSIDRATLQKLDSKSLARAFKAPIAHFDRSEFLRQSNGQAERKVLERIGLSRGAGRLLVGVDAAALAPADAIRITAKDLASRSQRKIEGYQFVGGEALGASAGMGWVGAVAIPPGQLAEDASYWLRVWYETALEADQEAREDAR